MPDEPPYSGDGYGLEDALTNLAEACDAIETAGPGESNDVLKAKAYYIGGMIPHDLDYSHALEQLTEAAERRITDDPNVGARIANQLEAGMEEPWYLCEIAEDEAPGALPDEFWTARPELAHIRQAAHARQRSAPAVLHAALARVAAGAPHNLRTSGG